VSTTETTTSGTLPAAWYRDPSGRHERRWWDGADWTDRVVDGDHESSDPPLRSQPVEPTASQPAAAPVAADPQESTDDDGPAEDPMARFEGDGRSRVPIEDRPTTVTTADQKPGRAGLIGMVVAGVVVVASLLWGLANHRTANEWRDRGEALQEELVTRAATADALEQALHESANRAAVATDGQETFAELEAAAVATVDQLRQCARDLNAVLAALSGDFDPSGTVYDANVSCNAAAVNGEALIALLDQISGP